MRPRWQSIIVITASIIITASTVIMFATTALTTAINP